jgi:DNA polymerase I
MKFRGWLLDVDYIVENDRPVIRMWCTDDEGRSAVIFDRTFEPYFYLVPYGDVPVASIENISDVVGGDLETGQGRHIDRRTSAIRSASRFLLSFS